MSGDLKPYLERSASTDLPFLLKAKEEAKRRMKDNPTKDNIDAFRKARDEVKRASDDAETPPPGGRLFGKRDEAWAYLQARGFKVGRSKFHKDCKAGKVPTDAQGRFEEAVILAYAAALPTVAKEEDLQTAQAARAKLLSSADNETEKALLNRMRRLKMEGQLVSRAEVERGFAARAQHLRSRVENWGPLVGAQIIELVKGDPGQLAAFLRFWESSTADWLDVFAADQEFVVNLPDDSSGDAA